MLSWLVKNRSWVFSGIGVALIVTVISWIFPEDKQNIQDKSGEQTMYTDNESTGIQVQNVDGTVIVNVPTREAKSIPEKAYTDLSIVDIRVIDPLGIDYKLKNSGTDSAFLKSIRFGFYPGSSVLSICMPVFSTSYEIPVSAKIIGQTFEFNKASKSELSSNEISRQLKDSIEKYHRGATPDTAEPPLLMTDEFPISQVVPPRGVDRFDIRFRLDEDCLSMYGTPEEDICRWSQSFWVFAEIAYDEKGILKTKPVEIWYRPSEHCKLISSILNKGLLKQLPHPTKPSSRPPNPPLRSGSGGG